MVPGTYVVNAQGGLWLRDGPGTDQPEILLLPNGATVDTDANGTEQNGFASVFYGNVAGWSSIKFLSPVSKNPVATVAQGDQLLPGFYEITGQDVALRMGPEISEPAFGGGSNVIVTSNKGEVVDLEGQQENGFAYVMYKGQTGWMSMRYLVGTQSPPTEAGPLAGRPTPVAVVQPKEPAPVPQETIQTEVGKVSAPVVAGGLALLALAIYFVAK
jgi:hypothetical protein